MLAAKACLPFPAFLASCQQAGKEAPSSLLADGEYVSMAVGAVHVSKCLRNGLRVGVSQQAGRESLAKDNSSPDSGPQLPLEN